MRPKVMGQYTMHSHDDIKRILLDILGVGLLRIRAFGNSGLGNACRVEADHLHNLPTLIRSFRWDLLLYYYNVERPAFLTRTDSNTDQFHPLWSQLDAHIQAGHLVTTRD
jgi:hypothetical protein